MSRRLTACVALAAAALTPVAALAFLLRHPGAIAFGVIGAVLAIFAGWYAITRRGVVRVAAASGAVVFTVLVGIVLVVAHSVTGIVVVVALDACAALCARSALRGTNTGNSVRVGPATRGVVFLNPKSGGGKVAEHHLVEEARTRGIEPVMLEAGDDLRALARSAVEAGADVIGAAGGDGTQALVAEVAMEHGVAFVCIPAGTRNHFALDVGVDRNDVTGALDAFVDGWERRIDLGVVNGRVFMNNVSFGVYAEIVQSDSYRDQKLATAAQMLPELLGPDAKPFDLRFTGPEGESEQSAPLLLVSNNPYELARLGAAGRRPSLSRGVLGIVAIDVQGPAELAQLVTVEAAGRIEWAQRFRSWTAPSFEVRSSAPVAAGVDGESMQLDPPVRLEIRPGALRVRVTRAHLDGRVGAAPHHDAATMRQLLAVATGRTL